MKTFLIREACKRNIKQSPLAFAGMDARPFQSGTFDSKSRRIFKRGSPHLRKALFMVASTSLQHSDPGNPIFRFMDKKRARVKAHLAALDAETRTAA